MNESGMPVSSNFENNQERKSENEIILKEKLTILRRGIVESVGAENAIKTAQCLYEALYHPENVDSLIDELRIKNVEKFPNRLSMLRSALKISLEKVPTVEEFVSRIARAFTSEANFSECIYAGADEQLENMVEMGPVRIWTAGDVHGLIDANGEKIPGSKGQLKKIVKAGGIREIRNRTGRDRYPDADDFIKHKKEIISVLTSEKKIPLILLIGKEFREKGIEIVVIIEDNLKNLILAEEEIKQMGFESLPIWIRQGDQRNRIPKESGKELEYYLQRYNAQDSVTGICKVLKGHSISAESKPGFIVDYDEVFMDANKKMIAQEEAVLNAIKENNWM
ncbi:MAG: hypothetical protein UR60_C0028G0016 [Candidatus Moranbacteria bacterium GW2011_GWF2_34_56]|nr:MAG: hypothetical protein UR51_C0002G0156 [Candidatus Moranbacteria bacterium GW2011_GWF1_34_10]KKP64136.1 MAG: hypothetical protein UR60_C0028G0016 [Candidatus Moranbacteria bacterium GW2011_GWF2_34_56]HBI17569.1 hypothetical protein [Candidatus Moranbacteria bacterium]